jgi:drug/metabolite transporter (DMT)-like permease
MGVLTAMGVSWIDPERISIYGFLGAALILLGVVIAIAAQGRTQLRKTIAKGWRLGLKRE